MIKRGQVFVRAKKVDGSWGAVDVLDLDEVSFRAFMVSHMVRAGFLISLRDEVVDGDEIEMKERQSDGT